MITGIQLKHFKCFSSLDLRLGKVTLLTGKNSTGKSSVIQALLLLHQSLNPMTSPPALVLNGDFANLGSVNDVEDRLTGRGCFSLGVTVGETLLEWEFDASKDSASNIYALLNVSRCAPKGELVKESTAWLPECNSDSGKVALHDLRRLLHVSTDRVSPQETYGIDPSPNPEGRLGPRGEFAPWFLFQNSETQVHEDLRLPDVPPQLGRQVSAWLGSFFPGASLEVRRIPGTSLLTLHLKSSSSENYYRPMNVGFGLTNILPILVGGLASAWDRIFIVENPEAHLHPSAQAQMADFLVRVAASGAQVILESHSDHILNGLRRAVKNRILDNQDVVIHFFEPRNNRDYTNRILTPQINKDGYIDEWPNDFFDQLDRDLEELVKWD